MSNHYTEADRWLAANALWDWRRENGPEFGGPPLGAMGTAWQALMHEQAAVILDAVAPAIAARALRDTAALLDHTTTRFVNHAGPDPLSDKEFEAAWLRARADEIEAGR